jgi:hypothetical protein
MKLLTDEIAPCNQLVLRFYLAVNLVLADFYRWRHRRVEKIRALDYYAYGQNSSFQFVIPHDLIFDALKTFALHHGPLLSKDEKQFIANVKPIDLIGQELEALVPVDRYEKKTLMGFSVRDPQNKAVPFLPKHDGTLLGAEVLRNQLRREITRSAAAKSLLLAFVQSNTSVFQALTYTSPLDLAADLRQCGLDDTQMNAALLELNNDALQIGVDKYKAFIDRRLKDTGLKNLAEGCEEQLSAVLATTAQIAKSLRSINDSGLLNPAINPLLLVGDYFAYNDLYRESDIKRFLHDYLSAAQGFVLGLDAIRKTDATNGTQVLTYLFAKLHVAAHSYIGFLAHKVTIGEPFIIKTEQVLKADPRIWPFYQGYAINLGVERSWHLEIICPSPAEVSLLVSKHRIQIGSKKFLPEEIFGVGIDMSRERVHYYKTRNWEQIEKALELKSNINTPGFRPRVVLWVRYKIERHIVYLHAVSFLIVLVSLLIVVTAFHPSTFEEIIQGKSFNPALLFPVIGPLIAIMLTAKEKENITTQRLKWLKQCTVVGGGILYLYVLWKLVWMYLSRTSGLQ